MARINLGGNEMASVFRNFDEQLLAHECGSDNNWLYLFICVFDKLVIENLFIPLLCSLRSFEYEYCFCFYRNFLEMIHNYVVVKIALLFAYTQMQTHSQTDRDWSVIVEWVGLTAWVKEALLVHELTFQIHDLFIDHALHNRAN